MRKDQGQSSPKGSSVLQRIDLNLLRIFDVIYREQSVSRAAEQLHITPSAVSHSLNKLRFELGDELFFRSPHGMIPTARAAELASNLHRILRTLEETLDPKSFRPQTATRTFSLSCIPYLNTTFLPRLSSALYSQAPGTRLELRTISRNPIDELDAGLDVAIGSFRRVPPRYVAEELFREKPVWILRADHEALRTGVSLETLVSLPHVDVVLGGNTDVIKYNNYNSKQGLELLVLHNNIELAEMECKKRDLRRNIRWVVSDSLSAISIVKENNAACLMPQSFARQFAALFGVAIVAPPYRSTPLIVQMIYSASNRAEFGMHWFLEIIRETATDFPSQLAPE
jgi:DNA-binding transcriptional LysR family regulator